MSDEITQLLRSIERQVSRIADAICDLPPPPIRADQAYSVQEAARLLGVNVWTINRARKEGKLVEAQRLTPRYIRITGESMLAFHQPRNAGGVRVLKL